jgi:hypothetical protein
MVGRLIDELREPAQPIDAGAARGLDVGPAVDDQPSLAAGSADVGGTSLTSRRVIFLSSGDCRGSVSSGDVPPYSRPPKSTQRRTNVSPLVVSELATNAVTAGRTVVSITVEIHRGHVRVAAFDDGPGVPRPVAAGPNDRHGRGVAIVHSL